MHALDRTQACSRHPRPVRRAGLGLAVLLLLAGLAVARLPVHAQVSVTGHGRNFVAPVTDAQGRRSVLRGKDVSPAGPGLVAITGMQTETYRGQEKDMIVQAPQCLFDTKANVASSKGSLTIHTADDRFSIEGEGFRWRLGDSRLTSQLVISNRVHSLVRKRGIGDKSGGGPSIGAGVGQRSATSTTPPTGTSPSTNEFIEITADGFEYQADRAVYRGRVHAHETEGDLTCGVLTVIFKGESGALERAEAEEDVVLNQGGTRAQAEKAVYLIDPAKDVIELDKHVIWTDGLRQGSGDKVVVDRKQRTIYTENKAYLRLPRAALNDSGFLATPAPPEPAATVATNAFIEVYSELMNIQLPPTNGPVQHVVAEKNVMIIDPDQEGRALAERAEYDERTGLLELTGAPMLESERRLVTGKVLRIDRGTRVLTATPDAYVKLPAKELSKLGLLAPANTGSTNSLNPTNRFIEIWAERFDYKTNEFDFHGQVRANFLQGDVAQGKLTCASLVVKYGEQIESILAENDVELRQFPIPASREPVIRNLRCARLKADFSKEGRLRIAVAEQTVNAEQEENRIGKPRPILSSLTSDKVTAYFSTVTNQVERIVAEKEVVFAQDSRTAHGTQAVYTQATGLIELTGQPTAVMPEGRILKAECLIWDQVHQRFMGRGKFRSEWQRPPGATNRLAKPTAKAH
jgi:lipopolysaccharide export system protein LptA